VGEGGELGLIAQGEVGGGRLVLLPLGLWVVSEEKVNRRLHIKVTLGEGDRQGIAGDVREHGDKEGKGVILISVDLGWLLRIFIFVINKKVSHFLSAREGGGRGL